MNKGLFNKNIDAMAEAKKNEKFRQHSKDAMPRMRLAVEVYEARNAMGLSQQALAKGIYSTQKVISKIENGDMNIGIELLGRFVEKLNFDSNTLARVFDCGQDCRVIWVVAATTSSMPAYILGATVGGSTTLLNSNVAMATN